VLGHAAPLVSWPGEIHVDVVLGVLAVAVAYVAAWRARRQPIAGRLAVPFLGGLAVVLIALNGPLHDLSDRYLFTAHMVQHLLLTLLFPPLVLAGTPAWMLDALVGSVWRSRVARALLRRLTRPLGALGVYAALLVFWHLPGPYGAALAAHGWHIVEHLALMTGAVLAWWPVLSRSTLLPAIPYGAQILYLFVFGMPMTVVAAMVSGADHVLYPFYAAAPRITSLGPFEDQQLGGLIMWVPAGIVPLIAFSVVFFRWVAAESESADASPDANAGAVKTSSDERSIASAN
jgi:putative membrane protein